MAKDFEKLSKYDLEQRIRILKASLIDGISGPKMHEGMGYKLSTIANSYNFFGMYTGKYAGIATEQDIKAFIYKYPYGIEGEHPTFDDFLSSRTNKSGYKENYINESNKEAYKNRNAKLNVGIDYNNGTKDVDSTKLIIKVVAVVIAILAIYKAVSWIENMISTVGRAVTSDIYFGTVIVLIISSIAMWIYEKSNGMSLFKRIIMIIGLYFTACSFVSIYQLLVLHNFQWAVFAYILIAYFTIKKTVF